MLKRICSIVCLFLLFSQASAQLAGIVRSSKNNKPLTGVEVFINRSTLHTVTDESGLFELANVPQGFVDVVLYKSGFVLYQSRMRIATGKNYKLNLQLAPARKESFRKPSSAELEQFTGSLMGDDQLKAPLTLTNPGAITFQSVGGVTLIRGNEPLLLTHSVLGYRLHVYTPGSFVSLNDAPVWYEDLQDTNVDQNISFEKNRQDFYHGSLRHWLTSLASGTADSSDYRITTKGADLPSRSLVSKSPLEGHSRIQWADTIVVTNLQNNAVTRIKIDGVLDFSNDGRIINPQAIYVSGAMNHVHLRFQLPMNYKALAGEIETTYLEAVKRMYEQTFVQTDKPYYYPGEPIWFKAYLNYYYPAWRDSLSAVLHVELLNPGRELMMERTLRIEHGHATGDFVLPDSLAPGNYYIRAYTHLQRNFGDDRLFVRTIPILSQTSKPDVRQVVREAMAPGPLTIVTEKNRFKPREKITLHISLRDGAAPMKGDLSVAVTDATQVLPVPEPTNIVTGLKIKKEEIPTVRELAHQIELSASFYGQFVNDNGKGEPTTLSFIQSKTGSLYSTRTDEQGYFWQPGVQFTDSVMFAYKSDKAKYRPYGKVTILNRKIAPTDFEVHPYHLDVIDANSIQRIVSDYEVPADNKLLEAVEVRGQSLTETARRQRRSLSHAEHVIDSKSLRTPYPNLLYALVGKVPGLAVFPAANRIYFTRSAGTSIVNSTSPMVMVDDSPMGGEAGDILASIDPNIVDRVELSSRLNVAYGSFGNSGVISIYLKEGATLESDPNFQYIKVPGFSRTNTYRAPDYSRPDNDNPANDFRSTIYWNPLVSTDTSGETQISFYAADLPGEYRVVVEGLAQSSEPVRSVIYIRVDEK